MPWDEDLNWLTRKLAELSPLYDRLTSLSKAYDHGVIYGVKFEITDLPYLKNLSTGMMHGVAYYGRLQTRRIFFKAMISKAQNRLSPPLERLEETYSSKGVLGALNRADNS